MTRHDAQAWRAQCRSDAARRAEAAVKLAPNPQARATLARLKTHKRGWLARIIRYLGA